jgi:hypothetical protein
VLDLRCERHEVHVILDERVVDALAVCRLTRLVTKDVILKRPRDWFVREAYHFRGDHIPGSVEVDVYVTNDNDPPKLATFITCPWCTSVWLSFGVVVLRWKAPRLWGPVARALAFSQLAGYAANLDVDT